MSDVSARILARKSVSASWNASFSSTARSGAARLVDKLLGESGHAVCVAFEHSPRRRREDLVDGRPVEQWLLVLEEADDIVDELACLVRRRVVEATQSLLEQHAPDSCIYRQSHRRVDYTIALYY